MTVPVVICTSAFGAEVVRQRGQGHFAMAIAQAGAEGIEIREELFTDQDRPSEALGARLHDTGLLCIYSSTLKLFEDSGTLNMTLADELAIAEALHARYIKVSLGQFPLAPEEATAAVQALGATLEHSPITLLIENDQTLSGGRIAPLKQCLDACRAQDIDIAMTFDVGNWYWTGNDPLEAARTLGKFVAYVHCKGVETSITAHGKQLAARVPDDTDMNAWSSLWQHFPAKCLRAIEFPLIADDDATLIVHAQQQIERLRELGQYMADQEDIA
ncbi:sugar phosphate isomerase/epimerase family protein [Phytohalomonas tamaricis]|uniref:sugar phosphate isomerase/epimerase family protein n=1 Tax=Phytohalomonas tamaricis TaxID=2081032 RepID=UPI000D0B035E|nr:TIM barrel protein [Phytohalomonas tamaricis]